MTAEEMAEEYATESGYVKGSPEFWVTMQAFLAGLKAGKPKWHKVADGDLPKGDEGFGKSGIHRYIYLKDRYGNLYTGNYYPKDNTHEEDCFAVEYLERGFQGSQFCKKQQIVEWCEIPQYNSEVK